MDGQKGQGGRRWRPVVKAILSMHTYIQYTVRISQFYCFSTVVSIPFCSLIPVRNIPQKVLFTQATYTRKHFILPFRSIPSIGPQRYPSGITFIAHFESASKGQIPMRMSFRSGFSDRVKEPKIPGLSRYI